MRLIQPNQVESVKDGLSAAIQKIIKLAVTVRVETDKLAIQNRVIDLPLSERLPKGIEALVYVSAAGN